MNGALSRSSKDRSSSAAPMRVAEQRGSHCELADVAALRIGVEQQLVRIEAMALLRLVRPVHAVAVDRAGPRVRQIAVPDLVGVLGQLDAFELASRRPCRTGRARPWWRCAENSAKLTPMPSQVAPSGMRQAFADPGHRCRWTWGFHLRLCRGRFAALDEVRRPAIASRVCLEGSPGLGSKTPRHGPFTPLHAQARFALPRRSYRLSGRRAGRCLVSLCPLAVACR